MVQMYFGTTQCRKKNVYAEVNQSGWKGKEYFSPGKTDSILENDSNVYNDSSLELCPLGAERHIDHFLQLPSVTDWEINLQW